MTNVTSEEGYCFAREDEQHCEHWWDGEECCNCKAPGMTMDAMVEAGMCEGPQRPTVAIVRFQGDDLYGLWEKGDIAEDHGLESVESGLPIRVLVLHGETITLWNPFGRGLILSVPISLATPL